ncbi:MAG: helix-turn-helix domain-containing protein [Faecousia sp.]
MVVRLKQLRQKKGVSQMQLAEAIGVSQQSINKYENHGVEPDIRTLIAMADYFGTSVDYLIGHTEVERVIEHTSPFELNKEEAQLVEDWRQLRPAEKESIDLIVRNYLQKA